MEQAVIVAKTHKSTFYLELLKRVQNNWSKENWTALRKKRRQIELKASDRRKKLWK